MTTVVAGSRHWTNYERLVQVMNDLPWPVTGIVTPTALGAAGLATIWAQEAGIPHARIGAESHGNRRAAVLDRNHLILKTAHALVQFGDSVAWDAEDLWAGAADRGWPRAEAGDAFFSVHGGSGVGA